MTSTVAVATAQTDASTSMTVAAAHGSSADPSTDRTSARSRRHWVGAWAAAPSDASTGSGISDYFDPSANPKAALIDQTVRAVLTPTYRGSVVRIHLSNRFGTAPVDFGHVTIAEKGAGAAVTGRVVSVEFHGQRSVRVAAGADVVSDPARFHVRADKAVAVSIAVVGSAGMPTEHYTARQTSYLSPAASGDHTTDASGLAYVLKTTSRPYVSGLDVRAPLVTGAVVTFGDSITDGYQGSPPTGIPEVASSVDADGRWPDVLGRRLRAAGSHLSVVNAGISGNRVLRSGAAGGNDTFGPAALTRLRKDVLSQPGVRTVIWLEGINDLGQAPTASRKALEAGWRRGIAMMHRAGLRVLQGTLTPSGGANGAYGTAATNRVRQRLNAWIRTKSPADGVIDFDAAVRDPADPSRILARYDGGDHLHFDLAGYRAMGNAVRLRQLTRPR